MTAGPIAVDVIAFLWACLAQFDAPSDAVDTRPIYRITAPDLHSIPEARDRILRRLRECEIPLSLGELLPGPDAAPTGSSPPTMLRCRSAWTSTFVAWLERTGPARKIDLAQEKAFAPMMFGRGRTSKS